MLGLMTHTPQHAAKERLRGITSMIAAVFIFSIMDASLKRLSADYGAFQVSCMRCLSSLAFLCVPIAWRRSWPALRMRMPVLQLVRAGCGIGMLWTFIYAVHRLTLGETYAVLLCAPLIMTALSVPLLGEHVPRRRWLAIGVGLAGVLLVLRPTGNVFASVATLGIAALCAVFYALSALTVRTLGRGGNTNTGLVFWFLVLVGIATALLSLGDWHPIPRRDWAWLGLVGFTGALGQYWITDAFRRAPPSVVGPFEYTSILWAFAIDWIFWSAKPTAGLVAGAAVVIASGVYVIWDERRLSRLALAPSSPPP